MQGAKSPRYIFAPLEKCVGHSLKNLGPSQKTLRSPGVPSLLRAWSSLQRGVAKTSQNFHLGGPMKIRWTFFIFHLKKAQEPYFRWLGIITPCHWVSTCNTYCVVSMYNNDIQLKILAIWRKVTSDGSWGRFQVHCLTPWDESHSHGLVWWKYTLSKSF